MKSLYEMWDGEEQKEHVEPRIFIHSHTHSAVLPTASHSQNRRSSLCLFVCSLNTQGGILHLGTHLDVFSKLVCLRREFWFVFSSLSSLHLSFFHAV